MPAPPVSSDGQLLTQATELQPQPAIGKNGLLSPFASIGRNGLQGSWVVRSPEALRLPPAFIHLKLAEWLINSESQGKPCGIREPVLITHTGTLISGFAEWHAAVFAGQAAIDCIEFALNDDEAFQLLMTLHRPRPGWNAFTRTELALHQERYFQSRVLTNRVAGAKHKGLANLPKAEHIDVRREIASLRCSNLALEYQLACAGLHLGHVEVDGSLN